MKIDGFVPVTEKVLLEEGCTFHYDTPYGSVTIIGKLAGDENEAFAQATVQYSQSAERDRRLGAETTTKEQFKGIVGLYARHIVIEWSTTAKSDGKKIEPSIDNFVALMTSQAFKPVFGMFQDDCGKMASFKKQQEGKTAKN